MDALSGYWDAFPTLRATLFCSRRTGYSDLAIDVSQVQQAVLDSNEFKAFAAMVSQTVADWFSAHRPLLQAIDASTVPQSLVADLGDDLLARVKHLPLLDPYDVYERLLTYWHDVMHDDVWLIMNDGWMAAARPRKTIEDKDRKLTETPDLVVGSGRQASKSKMDLIPPALVAATYLEDMQREVDKLNEAAEEAAQAVESFAEEHAIEGGLLSEAMDDGRVTKALATSRLREAEGEGSDPDEIEALRRLIKLYADETATKKAAKDTQAELDAATLKKYADLNVPDIKRLVLDVKWRGTLAERVAEEVNMLTLSLVSRIQDLGSRYSQTVAELEVETQEWEQRVSDHLARMGVK